MTATSRQRSDRELKSHAVNPRVAVQRTPQTLVKRAEGDTAARLRSGFPARNSSCTDTRPTAHLFALDGLANSCASPRLRLAHSWWVTCGKSRVAAKELVGATGAARASPRIAVAMVLPYDLARVLGAGLLKAEVTEVEAARGMEAPVPRVQLAPIPGVFPVVTATTALDKTATAETVATVAVIAEMTGTAIILSCA